MRYSLRLYFRYMGVALRGQMQYRTSFWLLSFSHLAITFIEFLGIWAMFSRFGSIRGWSFAEIAVLYGIVHIAFSFAEGLGRGFDTFPELIKSGDFDRLLLRPCSTLLQVAGQDIQMFRVGRLLQGMLVMGWGVTALGIHHSPLKMFLLFFAIAGGACLFYGLLIVQATIAFWTIESLELMNTVTYGGTEAGQYPLTLYRSWFRLFFTFVVPIASINYLPAPALLGRSDLGAIPVFIQWTSPVIGLAYLMFCLQTWKLGVRHYRSTGS
jgi:ABC-2 type transport system permease protein